MVRAFVLLLSLTLSLPLAGGQSSTAEPEPASELVIE